MKLRMTARQIAEVLRGTVEGNPEAEIQDFAKIEHGRPGRLCFFANPKYEKYVYDCEASVLLVRKDFQPKSPVSATMVRVEDPYNALAELLDYVTAQRRRYRRYRGRHATWPRFRSELGRKVYLGDHSHIGLHVSVGDFTKIYENVYVGDHVKIGSRCILYPGVRIYAGSVIGDGVIIHSNAVIGSDGFGNAPQPDGTWKKIAHLGRVLIGNDVEIGACTTIDRAEMEATVIGNGVKIDNLCQIAHNVEIGDNTVMAAQCGIAGSAKIGKNCIIAGQVGIVGHITIADHTTIGAQSGIIGNVRTSGQVLLGSPAFSAKQYMRSYAMFKAQGVR